MIKDSLQTLGNKITRLRIAKNLKQSELAYEAGISERTLQRMEAGEVVKSDGLLKVIAYLGRLDDMLGAIDTPGLSPYELANRPTKGKAQKSTGEFIDEITGSKSPRARVRTSKKSNTTQGRVLKKAPALNTPGEIVWPEDQT
jgi:transcriptional regulator with XRE-family HTH domain